MDENKHSLASWIALVLLAGVPFVLWLIAPN